MSGSRTTVSAVPQNSPGGPTADSLACLLALEQKVLWIAVWMIHHANNIRSKKDGLKVGGHQASSASVVTLMTALFLDVLEPADRVAVKPHASPVFHAIQYLLGRQTRGRLEDFRALGGAQSYPSRTKDADDVDFSTGSVGLGVAMTTFAALVQEYVQRKGLSSGVPQGRMVALVGDAELDEGNVFEALLEGWKHDVRNLWWIIDYNRQSLDAITPDRLYPRIENLFRDMEWRVVTLKYGQLLQQAFTRRGGDALRDWIDACPNSLYSALAFQGGGTWRRELLARLGDVSGIRELLDEHGDTELHQLMTNLAGHDLVTVLDAFHAAQDDQPTCFIAYTIKGYGLPFAGHKDNHAGLMSAQQLETLKRRMNIADGEEWSPYAGLDRDSDELDTFLSSVPFNQPGERRHRAARVTIPATLDAPQGERISTQEGFGRILSDLARQHPELADRIVTTSPDVTVSTNLGGWVNRRHVFDRREATGEGEHQIASPQRWVTSPSGQHIELGIAENNLFILLAALGLSDSLFGVRLLPIGTVYDPFIARGLDALNYACYQGARFILAATPSGITLAPEGGAHQSVLTPLIGIGQPGLTAFEPAFVDELAVMFRWSLDHLQADDGEAVYLRLSTRPVQQMSRVLTDDDRARIIEGGYWMVPPTAGAELAIVASGAVVSEAIAARDAIAEDIPGAGLLIVTSADRLQRGWQAGQRSGKGSHIERLLGELSSAAGLVTVLDGHPATLSWLGAVKRQRVMTLGVDHFGQSGNLIDLYREYGLDTAAILDAAARLCVHGD